jgi:hypothetical protein
MPKNPDAAAVAAFDICDSLLLTLVELKILTNLQAIRVLEDVSDTHIKATEADGDLLLHRQTAERIQRLINTRVALP